MKLIGMIVNETTPKVSLRNVCFTTRGSDSHRGGGIVVVISKDNGCSDSKEGTKNDELGWHTDISHPDEKQRRWGAEDA